MLYENISKIFSILFIQIFFFILNKIKKEKIFIKYYQINKIKVLVNQSGENIYKYNIKSIRMTKKVVYSVIIDDYDKISPFPIQEGFDYFLFSDVIYNNTNWTIIPFSKLTEKENASNIKMTRYAKLFPHLFFNDYELSIYLDASYIINGDLNELLLRILNPSFDLYFIQHPFRNTIFQECSEVINVKKDTKESVNIVKNRYIKENFPDNLGLTENCIT